jgi:predicted nucleotidyltransferase
MDLLQDQLDLLSVFHANGVRFIVIGGHAVNIYTEPRYTHDLDVLVSGDETNGRAVYRALAAFGAPLQGLAPDDFIDKPTQYFQVGVPPARVDVFQSIPAVSFENAWRNATLVQIGGHNVRFLSLQDLIQNKLAAGRPKDLVDAEELRKFERKRSEH